MSTTSRQSVTFTGPQLEALKRDADQLGITVSDLIRRIVDEWRFRPAKLWISPPIRSKSKPINFNEDWIAVADWDRTGADSSKITGEVEMVFYRRPSDKGQQELIKASKDTNIRAFRHEFSDGHGYFRAVVMGAAVTATRLLVSISLISSVRHE